MPSHYLNQYWNIINWTLRNNIQWNLYWQRKADKHRRNEVVLSGNRLWSWLNWILYRWQIYRFTQFYGAVDLQALILRDWEITFLKWTHDHKYTSPISRNACMAWTLSRYPYGWKRCKQTPVPRQYSSAARVGFPVDTHINDNFSSILF